MTLCARVLSLPLTAAFLLLTPAVASATSVSLIWTGVGGVSVSGLGTNTLNFIGCCPGTLTLDVILNVDSRGVAGLFLTIDFDTDLSNELNLLAWEEISWAKVNIKGITTRTLTPIAPGIQTTIESTGSQAGTVFEFDGTSLGLGPANTTLTFARLVFLGHIDHNELNDGDDIFSSGIIGCNAPDCDITSDVSFGGASVGFIPEPGTAVLLGLGVGALALAGRRRGRK